MPSNQIGIKKKKDTQNNDTNKKTSTDREWSEPAAGGCAYCCPSESASWWGADERFLNVYRFFGRR